MRMLTVSLISKGSSSKVPFDVAWTIPVGEAGRLTFVDAMSATVGVGGCVEAADVEGIVLALPIAEAAIDAVDEEGFNPSVMS